MGRQEEKKILPKREIFTYAEEHESAQGENNASDHSQIPFMPNQY